MRSAWEAEAEEGEEGGRNNGWEEDLQVKRRRRSRRKWGEGDGDEAAADKRNDKCAASLTGQLPRLGRFLMADRLPDTLSIPPGCSELDAHVDGRVL